MSKATDELKVMLQLVDHAKKNCDKRYYGAEFLSAQFIDHHGQELISEIDRLRDIAAFSESLLEGISNARSNLVVECEVLRNAISRINVPND